MRVRVLVLAAGLVVASSWGSGSADALADPSAACTPYPMPFTSYTDPLVFNCESYLGTYPDLRAAFGTDCASAETHWLTQGIGEGRHASSLLDPPFYLAHYPDLRNAFGYDYAAAIRHYISYGRCEGRVGSAPPCGNLAVGQWMFHADGRVVDFDDFLVDPPFRSRTYVAGGLSAAQISTLHAHGGIAVVAASHDISTAGMEALARSGADWIVVDEIVWWKIYGEVTDSWDTAAALAAPEFNQLRTAARNANPAVRVALVEPFEGLIERFWSAGGRADMLMGEDYRGPHPGDIRAAHLSSWKQRFNVAVGQWVLGVTNLPEYSGTDMVIVADWSDPAYPETKYYDALKRVMLEGCAASSPIDKPFGSLDVVGSGGFVGGWAMDPDATGRSIAIDFWTYDNDWVYVGSSTTNQLRPDVDQIFGTLGEHGYGFSVPVQFRGRGLSLYAFGIDADYVPPYPLLGGSPKLIP